MPTVPTGSFAPDRQHLRELTARCRDFCYSAVRTLAVLPDREWTWLNRMPGGSPEPAFSPAEALKEWGLDLAVVAEAELMEERRRRAARYRPSPAEISRYLDVLGWIAWLERERNGRTERKIIVGRASGLSYASLAERLGRSDDTVRRWEAAAFVAIVLRYHAELEAMR